MKHFLLAILFVLFGGNSYAAEVMEKPELQKSHVDRNTMVSKKIAKAKACIEKGDYTSAQSLLYGVLKLSPSNTQAKTLLETCKRGVKAQEQKERRLMMQRAVPDPFPHCSRLSQTIREALIWMKLSSA